MLDPLRSEADAFRILVYLVVAIAVIVVVVLIARALT
jgi:predicted nucleic acid-binding Zn ribbon protein